MNNRTPQIIAGSDRPRFDMQKSLSNVTTAVNRFNKGSGSFHITITINEKGAGKYLTFEQIMAIVCQKSGLTPEYILMESREPGIVRPRQICHYMASIRTKKSLNEIGRYFGGKNHDTVINSIKKIKRKLSEDSEFRHEWDKIINQFNT